MEIEPDKATGRRGGILAVSILAAFKIFCAYLKPMEARAEFLQMN